MRDDGPEGIMVSADRRALTLDWTSGRRTTASAQTLRLACRCAWCTRDRILGQCPGDFADVAIAKAELIGAHALHIGFSDGHARGIFPFPYLSAIAEGTGAEFQFAPAQGGAPRAERVQR